MADVGRSRGNVHMATLDEIGQEKQRVSERLARIDTERARLADQLSELEIAERVLGLGDSTACLLQRVNV